MNTTRVSAARLTVADDNISQLVEYRLLLVFSCTAIAFGFVLNTPAEVIAGTAAIITAPSVLMTDYMEIANPGATFVNAGVMMLLYVLYVRLHRDRFTGPLVASLFTVFGFSFFGKNLLNSLPITLGVYLWARISGKPSGDFLVPGLLGTALAPAVSFIAFGKGLPVWQGLLWGYAVGIAIGILIPPLAGAFIHFHHGLSLYNVGFTTGMLGMVVMAVLDMMGRVVPETSFVYTGDNRLVALYLYGLCALLLASGWYRNGKSLRGLGRLMRRPGLLSTDFFALDGVALTSINMACMGVITTTLVLVTYGRFSGSVLGAIFTVIGFAAFGKHPRNTTPIIVGVILSAALMGYPLGARVVLVSAFFGTSLAPMAGLFGPVFGVVAGFLHMALVANVAFLHGGLNLYNNGFSAGFVAIILCPAFLAVYRLSGKPEPRLQS